MCIQESRLLYISPRRQNRSKSNGSLVVMLKLVSHIRYVISYDISIYSCIRYKFSTLPLTIGSSPTEFVSQERCRLYVYYSIVEDDSEDESYEETDEEAENLVPVKKSVEFSPNVTVKESEGIDSDDDDDLQYGNSGKSSQVEFSLFSFLSSSLSRLCSKGTEQPGLHMLLCYVCRNEKKI